MGRKKHRKNAGMSLLEVIVAVSIFSIAAMVLLQGFVTSGRINRKSNLYLEATSTAQNVMEELKAKTFEEVSLAFNYPIDQTTGKSRFAFLESQKSKIQDGTLSVREKTKAADGTYSDVRINGTESQITASIISGDGGKTYRFNPRKTGDNASKYYFQMTNVENLHEAFDILVEFDGSRDSGYKKKTSLNQEVGKNDYEMPNIARLDTTTNAFLIMEKDWDDNAMNTLLEKELERANKLWNEAFHNWLIENPGKTEDDFIEEENPRPEKLDYEDVYKATKRTLEIKLEESGGVITAKARYTLCAYDYVYLGGGVFDKMSICPCKGLGNAGAEECCTYTSAYVPFYSSETGTELKNVYVFYYPNYNSRSSIRPLDEIRFDNSINYPVNLYISKQKDEQNNVPVSSQEIGYRMNLRVTENPSENDNSNWNTNLSRFKAQTKLRTNLDTNISGNPENIADRPLVNQTTVVYTDGRYSAKGASAKNVLQYNGLDDKQVFDRIYTAKVSVYRQGAAAENFPEEKLVVSLDGAKEN